ncbi:MAG TPA: murein transglycosylase [Enterobacter asburiae]|nr:murein transglycosylase [Enterobacter cloacae complex sp. ECNIH11]POV45856.1 murein transglycosylase [Enterobacter cloacae complex sp. ECNIH16]RAY96622.1 murein transglycosylase [Enterobacter asburiae]RWT16270.1 murein transglycosylase [Enterobacter asburiae]TYG21388.1 murein transglycosylase [Enterobacter asburiae]
MQPLFHINHDFVCKLNDMALFGLFFAQNLPKGMRSHFISPGGLLSSSRGNGQLKDEI